MRSVGQVLDDLGTEDQVVGVVELGGVGDVVAPDGEVGVVFGELACVVEEGVLDVDGGDVLAQVAEDR